MNKVLSNKEKIAILFLALGEETLAEIFRNMGLAEIQTISQYIAGMETPSLSDIHSVITETLTRISQRQVLPQEITEYINNVLIKALGEKKAMQLLEKLDKPSLEQSTSLKAAKNLDKETLFNMIREEHPQIIALILTHLRPDKAAGILSSLPDEIRSDVTLRICHLERIRPEVMADINEFFHNKMMSIEGSESQVIGGVNKIAEIFNNIDRTTEQNIMSNIEKEDPALTENIRMLMFTFEDLTAVNSRDMQSLLKEIPKDELILALKTASDELKELILKNMSERAAKMIIEDLESLGAVKLYDVEKAQQFIVKLARRLEEEGKIVLKCAGGNQIMV